MKLFILLLMISIIFIPFLLFSQTNGNLETRLDNLSEGDYSKLFTDEQFKHHLTDKNLSKQTESNIVVKKTYLDNGFLLIEQHGYYWAESNSMWVSESLAEKSVGSVQYACFPHESESVPKIFIL